MKKVFTAMTAISMTLQASDNLNQNINTKASQDSQLSTSFDQVQNDELNQYFDSPSTYSTAESNEGTLGASGSFLEVAKFVNLETDVDFSGSVTAGDILSYGIFTDNPSQVNASGAFLDDIPDANTSMISGSVITNHGNVLVGNGVADENVLVDMGVIGINETAFVSFSVTVDPIPNGMIREISNQALITTVNAGSYLSDDPAIYGDADPTVIKAFGVPTKLYDESESGDFVNHFTIPTQLNLVNEIERISGTIGGFDFEDCFQFDVHESRVVNAIVLEDYITSGDSQSTSFQVFTGLPPIKVAIGDIISGEINQDLIGINLLEDNVLLSGTYSVCLIEGTTGQTYSLVMQSDIEDNIFANGFD